MKKIVKNRKEFFVADTFDNFWQFLQAGRWEESTFIVFDEFLDHRHSFIDMGAWIGPTVLYGVHLAKHCYAIEPDPPAFHNLEHNLSLNPDLAKKVTLFNGCVSDRCGDIPFGSRTRLGDSGSSMLFGDGPGAIIVPALTPAGFCERFDVRDVNFIKIDIEGAERLVLPLLSEMFAPGKPTLHISLHPFMYKDKQDFADRIVVSLKEYRYVFSDRGIMLDSGTLHRVIREALSEDGIYSVIATDINSRCPERLLRRYKLEVAQGCHRKKKETVYAR